MQTSEDAVSIKPQFSPGAVKEIVETHYNMDSVVVAKDLNAFSAQNFLVKASLKLPAGLSHMEGDIYRFQRFLVKILHAPDPICQNKHLEAQFILMQQLRNSGFHCQQPMLSKHGHSSITVEKESSQKYIICVLSFLEGEELIKLSPWEPYFLIQVGEWLGLLRNAMQDLEFDELPALTSYNEEWHLENLASLRRYLPVLEESQGAMAETVISQFENHVVAVLGTLPKHVIHGDLHDENILLTARNLEISGGENNSTAETIKSNFALLDFEDIHMSSSVVDLAISLCYFMIASKNDDILTISKHIMQGYKKVSKLAEKEWQILYHCVCARYIQELVLCEIEKSKQKENEYVKASLNDGWWQIEKLIEYGEAKVLEIWKG